MQRSVLGAALLLVALPLGAEAQQGLGEVEFMSSCASCHGADAKGDGPFAEILEIDVPDLTRLAENNGGVFPVMDTLRTIDGRNPLPGHGGPMPVWGDRYTAEAEALGGPFAAEAIARGRLLSLVYYLEAIQE